MCCRAGRSTSYSYANNPIMNYEFLILNYELPYAMHAALLLCCASCQPVVPLCRVLPKRQSANPFLPKRQLFLSEQQKGVTLWKRHFSCKLFCAKFVMKTRLSSVPHLRSPHRRNGFAGASPAVSCFFVSHQSERSSQIYGIFNLQI